MNDIPFEPRKILPTLAALGGIAAICSGAAFADDGESFRLRLAGGVAASHASAQATQRWVERVEELSEGRVQIDMIWGGALLTATEVMPGVRDGRVDIGQSSTSWHRAELPLSYLATVPFLVSDGEASARAMTELYRTDETFRSEYERQGLHLIAFQPLDVALLGGSETWESAEDLKGLQIRAAGDWQEALSIAGAQPVGVPYVEIYEALQRGMIDGYGLNFEGIYDVQLHEVAPVMHDPGIGQISSMNLVISLPVWDSLPSDVQDIMEEAAADMVDGVSSLYADVNESQCNDMVDAGARFVDWTDEAKSAWKDAVGSTLMDDWKTATGDPDYAEAFAERYVELTDKHSANSSWRSAFDICANAQ